MRERASDRAIERASEREKERERERDRASVSVSWEERKRVRERGTTFAFWTMLFVVDSLSAIIIYLASSVGLRVQGFIPLASAPA